MSVEDLQRESPQGKRNQSFTGDKLDWMFAGTRRVEPRFFQVGVFIVQHINGRLDRQRWSPSEDYIAEALGISVRTVIRAVKFLERNRWLNVERKNEWDYRTRTWKTRNVYSLCMDNVQARLDEIADIRRKRRDQRDTGVRSQNVRRSVAGDTLGERSHADQCDTGVTLTPYKQELEREDIKLKAEGLEA